MIFCCRNDLPKGKSNPFFKNLDLAAFELRYLHANMQIAQNWLLPNCAGCMSTCNKIACKESLCHAVKGRCAWDGLTTRKSESLQGSEFLNYDT